MLTNPNSIQVRDIYANLIIRTTKEKQGNGKHVNCKTVYKVFHGTWTYKNV